MSSDIKLDFQDYAPAALVGDRSSTSLRRGESSKNIGHARTTLMPSSNVDISDAPNVKQKITKSSQPHEKQFSTDTIRQLIESSGALRSQYQPQLGTKSSGGGWVLGHFSQYFDISTSDVIQRIIWSIVPFRKKGLDNESFGSDAELLSSLTAEPVSDEEEILSRKQKYYSYIERFIQSRPDLYGPTWISITLAFAVVVFSNLVSFNTYHSNLAHKLDLQTDTSLSNNPATEELDKWHYNLDQLNLVTSLIFFQVLVLPSLLWLLFWFRGCSKYYTLIETVCAYGYSLSAFIPLSALLMYQGLWLRYTLILTVTALSGSTLTFSFLPIAKTDPNPTSSHLILVIIPIFQLTFAYFLHRIMLE